MSLLRADGVVGGYGASDRILNGASVHVAAGEVVALIGPNGAGKSTLLKAIAGLLATTGSISFDRCDIARLDAPARAKAGLAFVPQEANVFGRLSVAENLLVSGVGGHRAVAAQADAIYSRYPVIAQKRRALARTLSGGQRQMLAMAMGLMGQPKLMLLDEPTAGLSPKAADDLFDVIVALNRDGLPVLMVEQHAVEALAIAHRGYVLVAGRIEAEGAGPALADDPEIRRLFLGGAA